MSDYFQPSFRALLLVGTFTEGLLFYICSWMSHNLRRPAKYIGVAELLAASEAIEKGKTLKQALSILLLIRLQLLIAIEYRDLFTSPSTKWNPINKAIGAEVNVIHYEYETAHANEIIYIPGRVNLTDPGTDYPFSNALQIILRSG